MAVPNYPLPPGVGPGNSQEQHSVESLSLSPSLVSFIHLCSGWEDLLKIIISFHLQNSLHWIQIVRSCEKFILSKSVHTSLSPSPPPPHSRMSVCPPVRPPTYPPHHPHH
uniref:Uncharacterized protein n=1 Tax=Sphaerodactylus townsendi TaxID=933632 RepID=A0ACB8FB60_9SAUR